MVDLVVVGAELLKLCFVRIQLDLNSVLEIIDVHPDCELELWSKELK